VFFLNADRTVYGRYGTRSARDHMRDISFDGFKKAVEGALELHKNYPHNKQELAGKTGPAPRWKTAEAIPNLPGKVVRADGTRANCIHCHVLQTGELITLRKEGQPAPDRLLWPYPLPDQLGLRLDPKERATVQKVAPGSAAEKAGFRAGDQLVRLDGQPLLSVADVQWVLHHAAEPGAVKAEVRRGGRAEALTLPLEKGWRRGDFTWRTTTWPLRFRIAGLKLAPLPPAARKDLGLADDAPALRIEELTPGFVQDGNKEAAKLGLRKGDVIVAVDGRDAPAREADYLAYLVQLKKAGDKVKLTVLRSGRRQEFELPIQ
jgi:predicted metalloprotease with PDZ domain